MAYQTFALKYRPQTFDEIIGQDHVAITLRHAVTEGRVAHGYLFAGPRGTGKTSTARVLAKALSCEAGPICEPCCKCSICEAIAGGSALDLIEIDAASNRGIDDIRELRSRVGYAPTQARCKFYILDEAHMLTNEASNALLKTLEEPPEHVYFVLATTEPHNILPTIRSRCQSFEFRPIPQVEIVGALRAIAENEAVQAEEAALGAIARAAGGAMRDAESIFDQVIAYGRGDVTLEVVNAILGVTDADLLVAIGEAVAGGDIEGVFRAVDEVVSSGKDIGQLLEDLALYFRDLLRVSLGANPPEWMQTAAASIEQMQGQAQMMGSRRIGAAIEELGEAASRIRHTSQKPLLLEVTLAHLAATPGEQAAAPPAAAPATEEAAEAAEPQQSQRQAEEPPSPEAEASDRPAVQAEKAPAAEEVAAEAPETASEPDTPLTLDGLTEQWSRVTEVLRDGEHVSIAALIGLARPVSVEGDTVTLLFPADASFEGERVRDAYTGEIEVAMEAVYGRRLQLVYELQPPEAPKSETAPESNAPPKDDDADSEDGAQAEDEQEEMVDALKLNFEGREELEQ